MDKSVRMISRETEWKWDLDKWDLGEIQLFEVEFYLKRIKDWFQRNFVGCFSDYRLIVINVA